MLTKWIISAGFVARLKATGLPKCVTGERRGLRGGPEKRVDGVFLQRLQDFRYPRPPVYDCSPGQRGIAQDRTFYGKMDRCKERLGPATA